METIVATFTLLIGLVVGWILRTVTQKAIHAGPNCHMCGRHEQPDAFTSWSIRGRDMLTCARCHPYYKSRFTGAELKTDVGVVDTDKKEGASVLHQ